MIMIYGSWDYGVWQTEFFAISSQFLPFYPLNNLQNQNFERMKKHLEISSLQECVKNHDHMLDCSWDMAHDRCNFYFSFWAIFCPFNPAMALTIKIFKKWKNSQEISSLPKITITSCRVPEIRCTTDRQTSGHKKWYIEVGAPPKNRESNCIQSFMKRDL